MSLVQFVEHVGGLEASAAWPRIFGFVNRTGAVESCP